MLSISATDEWRAAHPGAAIGLLEVSNVANSAPSGLLDDRKRQTETQLRDRYAGYSRSDFLALPVMSDYERYYKRFDKTYHVQLQLESMVQKGKGFPNVSPLVDSNFVAELQTLILTAGHDVAKLHQPVTIDVSKPGDQITQMNGSTKEIRVGDMLMRDTSGVCCTIIYGQDNRSPISAGTTHALYVAYAPAGVSPDVVNRQLSGIHENIKLFAPSYVVEQQTLIQA